MHRMGIRQLILLTTHSVDKKLIQSHTGRPRDDVEEAEDGAQVAGGDDPLAELVGEVGRDVVVDGQLHAEAEAVAQAQDPCAVVTAPRQTSRCELPPSPCVTQRSSGMSAFVTSEFCGLTVLPGMTTAHNEPVGNGSRTHVIARMNSLWPLACAFAPFFLSSWKLPSGRSWSHANKGNQADKLLLQRHVCALRDSQVAKSVEGDPGDAISRQDCTRNPQLPREYVS